MREGEASNLASTCYATEMIKLAFGVDLPPPTGVRLLPSHRSTSRDLTGSERVNFIHPLYSTPPPQLRFSNNRPTLEKTKYTQFTHFTAPAYRPVDSSSALSAVAAGLLLDDGMNTSPRPSLSFPAAPGHMPQRTAAICARQL